MGSHTKFVGAFTFDQGIDQETLGFFKKQFGYDTYQPEKVQAVANQITIKQSEWKGFDSTELLNDVMKFAKENQLKVLSGFVNCEHEYGQRWRSEIRNGEVYDLEAVVTYKNAKKVTDNARIAKAEAAVEKAKTKVKSLSRKA